MEKICRNVHQNPAPDPFLILVNSQKQSMYTRNPFENEIFLESIIEKPLKS